MGNELVNGDVAKLHVAVGFLRSEVQNLLDKFEELKDSTIEEHRKVHDIIVAQSEAMRNLDRDLREIKPLFEDYRLKAGALNEAVELSKDYRDRKSELRGAKNIVVWLYGAVVLAAGWVGALVMNWLQGQRPPH